MTYEEISELIEEWEVSLPAEEYVRQALAMAESLAVGADGRAELLYVAGERLLAMDRVGEALGWFEEATADGGPTTLTPQSGTLLCLLHLDDVAAVADLLKELRGISTNGAHTDGFHNDVGEALETAGRPKDALRFYTMGLRDFDPAADDPDFIERTLLGARYRVRRYEELPMDGFDRCFEEIEPGPASAIRERVAQGLGY